MPVETETLLAAARQHQIPGAVAIAPVAGGHVSVRLSGPQSEAEILLHGAHVWHWQPRGAAPVLWRSPRTAWQPGTPMRGGIPVCWPWIGRRPDAPLHGPVRTVPWTLARTAVLAEGAIEAVLTLSGADLPPGPWPQRFDLELTVRAGAALDVGLTCTNPNDAAIVHAGALHTYLALGDARRAAILGLGGLDYHQPEQYQTWIRDEEPILRCTGTELNRTYRDTGPARPVVIDDPVLGRRLRIVRHGSAASVAWNPGVDRSLAVADLGEGAWTGFACIEAVNTEWDARTLAAGTSHRLGTTITVEPAA